MQTTGSHGEIGVAVLGDVEAEPVAARVEKIASRRGTGIWRTPRLHRR